MTQGIDLVDGQNSFTERTLSSNATYEILLQTAESGATRVSKRPQQPYSPGEGPQTLLNEHKIGLLAGPSWGRQSLGLERTATGLRLNLEFIPGVSLLQWSKDAERTLPQQLQVAVATCNALEAMHSTDILHQNVKASNLIVDESNRTVRLIDYALSVPIRRGALLYADPTHLQSSLLHVAPERTGRIGRGFDHRSDLYSLGVTFYELFVQQSPFSMLDPSALIHAQIARLPTRPTEVRPDLPKQLEAILLKLLAKDPDDRYQSAEGARRDLARCLESFERGTPIELFPVGREETLDHLVIPQRLYGRESEIQQLTNAFSRVRAGAGELVLLTGAPGIGKTTLARTLLERAVDAHGFFVDGKFGQFEHGLPFSAWRQALSAYARQLLLLPDAELLEWKTALLSQLDTVTGVLTEWIPDLRLVLGDQPEPPHLSGLEQQNRLEWAFHALFKVIAEQKKPLVILLDDLQWIDPASARLVKALTEEPGTAYVLLVACYRDREASPTQAFSKLIEHLTATDSVSETIVVPELTTSALTALLKDALRSTNEDIGPLSSILQARAAGNPLFLLQLLRTIDERRILRFDSRTRQWTSDLAALQTLEASANVVDLLVQSLSRLPESLRQTLAQAACLGARFDEQFFVSATGISPESARIAFQQLATEGLLIPLGGAWKFAHDRVQQAAYGLLDATSREATHFALGQRLLEHLRSEDLEARLFEVTDQFARSGQSANQWIARGTLMELDKRAGHKAMIATAYVSALEDFERALARLPDDAWSNDYSSALELHTAAAEAAFLSGSYERMERHCRKVHEHALDVTDRIAVFISEIRSHTSRGNAREAVRIGLRVLAELGLTIPEQPSAEYTQQRFAATFEELLAVGIASLETLPRATVPGLLAKIRILAEIGEPAYAVAPDLFVLWAAELLKLTLQSGCSPEAPFAFAAFALILCASEVYADAGYALCRIALSSLEPMQARAFRCKVLNIFGGTIQFWKEPVSHTQAILREGVRAGIETGDYASGAYNAFASTMHAFYLGANLSETETCVRNNLATIATFRQRLHWESVSGYLMATRRLLGASNEQPEPKVPYDLETLADGSSPGGQSFASAHAQILLTILAYHLDQAELARSRTKVLRDRLGALQGTFAIPVFYFYDSLIHLRYGGSPDSQTTVTDNQIHLARWAESAPANFRRYYSLVEAERQRVLGNHHLASQLYEQALADAAEQGAQRDEALAAELAASHCRSRQQSLAAHHYLLHAQGCYRKWGSTLLAARIEPLLQKSSITNGNTKQLEVAGRRGELDIENVLKATRAVSSELDLGKLVATLLRLLIESAGARFGSFLRRTGDEWYVEAEIQAEAHTGSVLSARPLNECESLAASVVRYVARTGQTVLLADAAHEGDFSSDPYVRREQIRSIFCKPLVARGETNSILYLENALVAGAFTVERQEVVDILAAQAAVSLETAHNYQALVELNRSLRQEAHERELVARQLRDSEERFRRFVMDCPVPFLIVSLDGRIDLVNRQFTEVFGYDASDIPDADAWWHKAYPNLTERARAREVWESKFGKTLILAGDIASDEYRPTTKDGRRLDIESFARLIGSQLLVVFNDVTARKTAERERQALEAQLQQSQKMEAIGTLAGGIAHDFNNILVGIIGYTEEALDQLDDKTAARESLELVMNCSQRAAALVNQILAFGRKSRPERTSLDLNDVVTTGLRLLRISLPANVQLVIQLTPQPCFIQGDGNQLQQILTNLCNNAAQAIGTRQGTLVVSTTERRLTGEDVALYRQVRPGAYVELCVSDNGPGMSQEILERIFEPFFTTKEPGKGTGLGLAVVHGIVKSHQGELSVESVPGEGSTFHVLFPLDTTGTSTKEPSETLLRRGNERILLVDDEELVLAVEARLLGNLGYRIVTAHSGSEALEILSRSYEKFDLIVTDQNMPNMSGQQLAEAVADNHPALPVILVTGYPIEKLPSTPKSLRQILRKPVSREQFSEALRDAFDGNHPTESGSLEHRDWSAKALG